jgi:hypothetical protein
MKLKNSLLKYFFISIIGFNACSAIFGIIYYSIPTTRLFWLWNIIGIVMFINWLLDMFLIYLNDRLVIKSNEIGKKINLLCYFLLVFTIIAMLFLVMHAFLQYFLGVVSLLGVILALIGILGISLLSIWLSYLDINNLENRSVWKSE